MPRTNAARSPKRGTVAMELLETQETRARDMRHRPPHMPLIGNSVFIAAISAISAIKALLRYCSWL